MKLLFWKKTDEEIIRRKIRKAFAECVKNRVKLNLGSSGANDFSDNLLAFVEITTLYDRLKSDHSFMLFCKSKGLNGYAIIDDEFIFARSKYFKQ